MGLLGMWTHCFLLRASPLALRSSSLCARSASLSSRVASRYATCCLRNSLRSWCRRCNNSSISERGQEREGQRVLILMKVLVYLLLIVPVKRPACSLCYIPHCKVAYLLLGCPWSRWPLCVFPSSHLVVAGALPDDLSALSPWSGGHDWHGRETIEGTGERREWGRRRRRKGGRGGGGEL